ncbi:SDR family oxidoreductase [Gordonia pseudamarae]|jgi:NAD(P)-dependent dehydrogenase (short-subunit alcohol dehydrogenase family)|uniref:SDR family oxidoreductase n=1 Tax=Gordonia pseudamarae TaxID=2831662 RepID=A0ABX6IH41_9ACTN|nr:MULTISPECIES: SDR family oxidoreductase [Gordonia]MBD0022530.1 SDR family oxidoreductase [Gordonia sp. (in: high G+C Gram-positive bacteria)]QHN26287.1 SDR family oxidoreductase [Gordonia pseudamarae]QHN35179.1 SDR family oxidoreductase [Gordonia pseudamarae]
MSNEATLAPQSFAGRVAVVTGGTSGIGAATVTHLARLGATVHAVGLQADRFDAPEGLPIVTHELDVTADASVEAFFDRIDRLDILVPAAGLTMGEAESTTAGFRKVIDINLLAVQDFCYRAAPLLARSDAGSIVCIASMMSYFGSKDGPAYSASKGAIVQLVKSMAQMFAADGTRVNAVAPGWVDTPLFRSIATVAPDVFAGIVARTPLARIGDPFEVAKAIAFLCSDDASFISGSTLPVDGGYLTV